jgi:hypothetical protein
MNLKPLILISGIAFSIFGCNPANVPQPDIAFQTPFPKRSINLELLFGNEITLANANDTQILKLSFNRETRENTISRANKGDTIFHGRVSRFRKLLYFSEYIADSAYTIYAVKLQGDQVQGLGTGHEQMNALLPLVGVDPYFQLVKYSETNENKKVYRLAYDRLKMEKFYKGVVDSLPVWKILKQNNVTVEPRDTSIASSPEIVARQTGGMITNVFPNPATEQFTIEFSEEGSFRVELYNTSGQQLKNINLQGRSGVCELNDVKPGIYIVKVTELESKERASFRLMVK